MKRKVIQLAGKTSVISLPKKWVEKYKISKGEELEIEEKANSLVISTKKPISIESIELDVTDMSKQLIEVCIKGAYKAGYEEIKLKFKNKETRDLKLKNNVPVYSAIRAQVDKLIGIEIISSTENYCLIKEITTTNEKEFDNIMRRIFLLILEMGNESYNAIKELKQIQLYDKHDTIEKLIYYCLRLLSKYGYYDYKKTTLLYNYLTQLEEIIHVYRYLTKELFYFSKPVRREVLEIFSKINQTFRLAYEIFYTYNSDKINSIYSLRREIFEKNNEMFLKNKNLERHEIILLTRLVVIIVNTLNLLEISLVMKIEKE
ncbi:MAG: AbrB/MazE/SpoVT family DNA-binding domain-containing protein [Candidatus Woesearchaeota archaeon]